MDPITIIVLSLTLGMSEGLKSTAEQAVKDAYAGMKNFIKNKYSNVNIDLLESNPASKARQDVVKEELQDVEANNDTELLKKAKRLLELFENLETDRLSIVGVELAEIKGASLAISDIIASGTGVSIQQADISGDIEIKQVRAGNNDPKASRQ